jgi:hypothetical protein
MTGKHLPRVRGLDLDPVDLLRNVNTDGYRQARSPFHELSDVSPSPLSLPYIAIESQSLISSQEKAAGRATQPTAPSRAADVKAIPAPLARTRSCRLATAIGRNQKVGRRDRAPVCLHDAGTADV